MELIPAIDLRNGRCVRLYQGDFAQEVVFSEDPAQVARHWHQLGATRLHVVDLDGARAGRPANTASVRSILESVPIPIELGGGIRDLAAIEEALGWGIERVVLGTVAVQDPGLVAQAFRAFPGAIVVGVDARGGRVAIQGWREVTSESAVDLVRRLSDLGAPRFIYTDIESDGTEAGPNLQSLAAVLEATARPVIASGGVGQLRDLLRLSELGVAGAIIGRALYTGAIDLAEALSVVAGKEAKKDANN